jgi:hypothetical protein
MPEDLFSGASTAATGSISSNTASLLSFSSGMKHVIINNDSGKTAYFKFNDASSPTVSATVYDVSLATAEKVVVDFAVITNVSVYVEATGGVRVVGWK